MRKAVWINFRHQLCAGGWTTRRLLVIIDLPADGNAFTIICGPGRASVTLDPETRRFEGEFIFSSDGRRESVSGLIYVERGQIKGNFNLGASPKDERTGRTTVARKQPLAMGTTMPTTLPPT